MAAQPEKTASAQLIDGKLMAQQVRDEVAGLVATRVAAGKSKPTLAAVVVGNRVDSQTYVRNKGRACLKNWAWARSAKVRAGLAKAEIEVSVLPAGKTAKEEMREMLNEVKPKALRERLLKVWEKW